MDAAFVLVEAGPAAVAVALARPHTPRARHATDGGIAVLDQRMARQDGGRDVDRAIGLAPTGQWVESEPAVEELDLAHGVARLGLEALAAGDLGGEARQRATDRDHLAELAAGVGVARPQRSV